MKTLSQRIDSIRQLPLHQYMGLTSLTADEGSATLCLTVGDNALNPGGMLHGGVVYTIADVCAYAAVLTLIEPQQEAVTHDLHIAMMRPCQLGDRLRVEAKVIKCGRSLAFVDVTVFQVAEAEEKIVAVVRATKSIVALSNKT